MSEQQVELIDLSDQDVLHYLKQNPEFFNRFPEALTELSLPHGENGTISLMERQARLMRDKNKKLSQERVELLEVAQQNEKIYRAFINLYMTLLDCPDSSKLIYLLEHVLVEHIDLDGMKLALFNVSQEQINSDCVVKSSQYKEVLEKRLSRDTYYFGRLTQAEMEPFFPANQHIESVCLIRLGEQKDLGILAFGSHHVNHFTPEMDTVFLEPMVKLINRLLFNFERD